MSPTLGGNQGLLVSLDGRFGGEILLGNLRVQLLGGGGEGILLELDTVGLLVGDILVGDILVLGTGIADQRLSLGSVVAHVLLGDLRSLLGLLQGNVAELGGLGADNLGGLLQEAIDKLLVGLVHQRGEEGNSGSNDSKSPVRNDLDEVVREECTKGSLFRLLAPI